MLRFGAAFGVPGPAHVGKLLGFARQFCVVTSPGILCKYGFSRTNLVDHVGPERFFERLATGMNGQDLGPVLYHLYPFGGIADGVRWMNSYVLSRGLLAVSHSSRG